MKQLLTFALSLWMALTVAANPLVLLSGGVTGGGGGGSYTYITQQDFEGTGYDNSETWVENGSFANEDYGTALEGSESLQVNPTAAQSYTQKDFTASDSVTICFMLRINSITSFTDFAQVYTGAGSSICNLRVDGGSHFRLTHSGSTNTTGASTYSTGTLYYVWYEYSKGTGADAVHRFYFSTTTTKPGSPEITVANGTSTAQAGRIRFGHSSSTTADIVIDHVRVIPGAPGTVTTWPL